MSTTQNDAAAYSQSHVSRICQRGFLLPSLWFSSSWASFSYGRSTLFAEAFLWPHCRSLASSQVLMHTPHVQTGNPHHFWMH